jgi:hypothetical protein
LREKLKHAATVATIGEADSFPVKKIGNPTEWARKKLFAADDFPSIFAAHRIRAREEFVTRPERVFCRPDHEVFGGTLFLENAND